ncbi:MAG: FAD-dependent monooxygenase [Pseudomonadota bacterium]
MTPHAHIVISGAGPVGQALALLLLQQGFAAHDIVLIDAKTTDQASQDARSIALSYGSKQILHAVQAWPIKATRIEQIHVSRRGHFGRSLITASDYALPALGYVARYGDIITPLQILLEQQQIVIKRPTHISAIEEQDDQVLLTLNDDKKMTADILVQAEGGIFGEQTQRTQHHDYQQTAVIAHITTSLPIPQRAFERFTEQGPLALLPQEDGYAMVWCVRPTMAASLLDMDDAAFIAALQVAFGERLGKIVTATPRHAYPLGLNAQASATKRTVAIGNAAQILHPVAGQGLNLGLRDAAVLAKCLTRYPIEAALSNFIAQRQTDRSATIRITDSMARVFASAADGSFSQSLLGAGLSLVDLIAPAKKQLAEQMMFGWR